MTAETRDWTATKQRLQQRWPGLQEEDLEASQGERAALVALLQGRLGYARPNAEQDLDEILAGEEIVPEDVADENTHTGTSGPVNAAAPDSSATSRPTALNSRTHSDVGGGMNSRAGTDRTTNVSSSETPELPDQPPEYTDPAQASAHTPGFTPEGMRGTGGPSRGDEGGGGSWGRDPWDRMHHNGRMPMGLPAKAIVIVGAAGTLLLVGMLLKRKKQQKHTRAEHVAEQARHLIEEISDRMPSVEELRDKVRSLEELREKKMASARREVRAHQ